jgi:peptide-methionine (S)-S-oxide reductase
MKAFKLLVVCAALATPADAAPNRDTAVLAGGCYWGMQEVFEHVIGVTGVVAGFAGAAAHHAEAVKITYDPTRISYDQLLRVFFTVAHDPTQVDRQGPDVGPSYRSAIYPQSAEQQQIAQAFLAELGASHLFNVPIATRIEQGPFESAEPDQQDFAKKHPDLPYVLAIDVPKVRNLKNSYPDLWRS